MEGSHYHFSCKTGYSLVGAGTLYCSDQGIWNGSFPTCFIGRQLALALMLLFKTYWTQLKMLRMDDC